MASGGANSDRAGRPEAEAFRVVPAFLARRGGGIETERVDRREFLKRWAECAAVATAGFLMPALLRDRAWSGGFPDLVVVEGGPAAATKKAVGALGGMTRFVSRGARVVIKPNMSFPNPQEWATTTHPEVVRALSELCVDAGAKSVLVLDNPLRNRELCLERSGLQGSCGDLDGVRAETLTDKRFFREVKVPEGEQLTSTMIMKQVLEADTLIAAPVAKSHSASGVSLAMKGMMGLIYDRRTFHLDLDLNVGIVDLCTVLKPALTVVDASRILSSGGPGGPGEVVALNRIIASTDMVAADAMAVEVGTWYGRKFRAGQVQHIRMARDRGLGRMDIENLRIQEVRA
ncbi:MAG: DUF362 domain-containing protein [Deltaproteobacteria bacterium]|nr:DUF362 domain-containing protein [Deltaproteobacteria bacterium]